MGVGTVSEMSCVPRGQDVGLSGHPRDLTTGELSALEVNISRLLHLTVSSLSAAEEPVSMGLCNIFV